MTQPTIARIERFALWTDRLARLHEFYEQQLGAQASPQHEDPATRLPPVFLDFCRVCLELIEPHDTAECRSHTARHGCVAIAFALGSADAVDQLTAHLAAAGHPLLEPPHRSPEGRYQSVVLDPAGHLIELTV